MTMCSYCKPWCSVSRKQLGNRISKLLNNPTIQIHRCPRCGGTEYMVSDVLIPDTPPPDRRYVPEPSLQLLWLAAALCAVSTLMIAVALLLIIDRTYKWIMG